jgi:hypothetical protein
MCGMYASSWEKAARSVAASRTSSTEQAFGTKSHLCASTVAESVRSRAEKRWPAVRVAAAGRP